MFLLLVALSYTKPFDKDNNSKNFLKQIAWAVSAIPIPAFRYNKKGCRCLAAFFIFTTIRARIESNGLLVIFPILLKSINISNGF